MSKSSLAEVMAPVSGDRSSLAQQQLIMEQLTWHITEDVVSELNETGGEYI